jgi:hypothetical protein
VPEPTGVAGLLSIFSLLGVSSLSRRLLKQVKARS